MSTFDIVIPCYNYARFLSASVGSAISQTGVDVRVLIIDDCSSDSTSAVGQQLASIHKNVEFRRHAVNRGHIATYNEGIMEWATGDYVVLLSADDMLAPGSLRRAAHLLNTEPNLSMVYGHAIHFDNESVLPKVVSNRFASRTFLGLDWIERRCRAGHNVIATPEVVVRGSSQKRVGGYRPELPHTGDLEMWLRLAAIGTVAHLRGAPQAFYRIHPASMQRTTFRGNIVDIVHRKAAFDSFFRECHNQPHLLRLQEIVNRTLAREALWDACRAYDHDRVEEHGAAELIEFARQTSPDAESLPEFAALKRRQRLGPAFCNRSKLFVLSAVAKRIERWPRKWRRDRWGI